jgi:3-oxoacyl-[acyl-carrier-protein] synthase II
VVTTAPGARRRVVITGLGPVSCVGTGAGDFEQALREGRCGTGLVASFAAAGRPSAVGGAIPDFAPEKILRRPVPQERQWGRSALFAAAAARLAADDAGLELDGSRAAVVFGTTSGETTSIVEMAERWHREGFGAPEPQVAARVPASRLALAAARELGTRGDVLTLGAACAAGNYALGYAYDLLTTGEADVAVAGGADSVDWLTHAGFHRTGALAKEVCRPFDLHRDGVVPAEGGSALVVEELGHAEARGARIYAEVLGWAMTCDAVSPNAQDAESIARCMRAAHHRAEVAADEVDYICAHGTGTRMNESVEAQAVRAAFDGKPPPISSIKSMLGHAMGAAAGFGAIACALSISGGFLPPTIHHRDIDPELADLDVIPNRSRAQTVRVAQNNGFGFGGNNAVALLGSVR